MEAHKLQLKIFLAPASAQAIDRSMFIPVLHRWIKDQLVPETLIDVVNYLHVSSGPSVVLIGYGGDYVIDCGDGRPGLLTSRKRSSVPPSKRLIDLAQRTFFAAKLLEEEPVFGGDLRFGTGELLFRVNDRLAARNTDEAFLELRTELEALATRLYAGSHALSRVGDPDSLLTVRIASGAVGSVEELLERAGGPPSRDG